MDSKSVVRVLQALGVRTYTPGYRNVYSTCPLAKWQHPKGVDERPSMAIKVDPIGDSVCMCWSGSCEFRGTLTSLAQMVNNFSQGQYDEAVALAEELETTDLQARLDAILNPEPDEEEKILEESMIAPFMGSVPRYAITPPPEGRGLSIETCKEWELGFDKYRNRLVAPVRNIDKKLVGMIGRAIFLDQEPPWWAYWASLEGYIFRKGNYLYGEHKVDPSIGRIYVVEGMPDVWNLYSHGFRNVVALLGSKLTFGHERKLMNWNCDIYWFLDGDDAGVKGTSQCCGLMRGKLKQYIISCPWERDPGALTQEETDLAVQEAEFVL